jgi:hypothetical protein
MMTTRIRRFTIVHIAMYAEKEKDLALTFVIACDVMHALIWKNMILMYASRRDYRTTARYVMNPCSNLQNLCVV